MYVYTGAASGANQERWKYLPPVHIIGQDLVTSGRKSMENHVKCIFSPATHKKIGKSPTDNKLDISKFAFSSLGVPIELFQN